MKPIETDGIIHIAGTFFEGNDNKVLAPLCE